MGEFHIIKVEEDLLWIAANSKWLVTYWAFGKECVSHYPGVDELDAYARCTRWLTYVVEVMKTRNAG